MENKVFFSPEGITTTSANYISNIAKEAYMNLEVEINNVCFYTTKVSLMGSSDEKILSEGTTNLDDIPKKLDRITKLKSLIAWFREAIKEKERLISEAKNQKEEEIAEILGISIPSRPIKETYPSKEELISKWDIKVRNRYYWLDTMCAVLGKYIHPDGHLSNARKDLAHKIQNPRCLDGSGRDAIMYSATPTASTNEVEDLYFTLQDKYRSFQAELNSMKHNIENELNEAINKLDTEYVMASQEYSSFMYEVLGKIEQYRNTNITACQSLKIAIPNDLSDLYKELSEIGKKR